MSRATKGNAVVRLTAFGAEKNTMRKDSMTALSQTAKLVRACRRPADGPKTLLLTY